MPKKKKIKKKKEEKIREIGDDSKLFAFLATFLSIIGFIIALIARPKDKYVMYYAKQSLVLFIFAIVCQIAKWLLGWIPVFSSIIKTGLGILLFVLWILSWAYALNGEYKEVPIAGTFAKKFNL